MTLNFLSLNNKKNLIEGVKLFKLKVNRDSRGILIETLKKGWSEIFDKRFSFGQSYCSVTNPGFARDEKLWHCHPAKQIDRFVVVKGNAVFALYDWRKDSKTFGLLNLFIMGERNGDENQYLLLIPKNILHGFCTVGNEPCYLLGFPTELYDPKEEGRVPFPEVDVRFSDGSSFCWKVIREYFHP